MNQETLIKDIFDWSNPEKQCSAAYQMRYIKNNPKIVDILLRACYEAKNPKLQQEAVRSLAVVAPEKAQKSFIEATKATDPERRRRGYYHLGTFSDSGAIELVRKGINDSSAEVRRAASVALGMLASDDESIEAVKRLRNDYEPESVKAAAKLALEKMLRRSGDKKRSSSTTSGGFDAPKEWRSSSKNKKMIKDKPRFSIQSYTPRGF